MAASGDFARKVGVDPCEAQSEWSSAAQFVYLKTEPDVHRAIEAHEFLIPNDGLLRDLPKAKGVGSAISSALREFEGSLTLKEAEKITRP